MFQQAFNGGDKYRLRSVFSAVQPALHWIIVEAAVHSGLPPLNKGAIDKKSQQNSYHEKVTKQGKNIYLFMCLYCFHAKAKP
jgi:hypothetical protein